MATTFTSQKTQLTVPNPVVKTKLSFDPGSISCESGGQRLIVCAWKITGGNGNGGIVIVDQESDKSGGQMSRRGASTSMRNGLRNGKCSQNIQRMMKEDFGRWSFTLVAQNGNAFGGKLNVIGGLYDAFVEKVDGKIGYRSKHVTSTV